MTMIAVLGASGTIGGAVARRSGRSGRKVLLLGRNGEKLAQLSAELGQPAELIEAANPQSLIDSLERAAEDADGFDGLVNCIGSLLLKPAHATTDEEFRRVVETNLFSAFATIRAGCVLGRRSYSFKGARSATRSDRWSPLVHSTRGMQWAGDRRDIRRNAPPTKAPGAFFAVTHKPGFPRGGRGRCRWLRRSSRGGRTCSAPSRSDGRDAVDSCR